MIKKAHMYKNVSTSARQHVSTSVRPHVSTSARPHVSTSARSVQGFETFPLHSLQYLKTSPDTEFLKCFVTHSEVHVEMGFHCALTAAHLNWVFVPLRYMRDPFKFLITKKFYPPPKKNFLPKNILRKFFSHKKFSPKNFFICAPGVAACRHIAVIWEVKLELTSSLVQVTTSATLTRTRTRHGRIPLGLPFIWHFSAKNFQTLCGKTTC